MTKAAERMNITQPAMSFQIRELEKEVAVPLFDRDRSGICLTEAGKILQSGMTGILGTYERLLKDVHACANGKTHLTVGYHGPFGWAGLLQFIGEFSEKHPEIEITVSQHEFRELADYLEQGILDVAFLESSELVNRSQLASHALFRDHACFAVAPFHRLAARASVTSADIEGEKILMNNHPSNSMASMISLLVRSGIRPESFRFYDRTEITMTTAAAGKGIAVIPSSFRIEDSSLHYVDYESDVLTLEYAAAWNAEKESSAVRLFIYEAKRRVWPYPQTMPPHGSRPGESACPDQ